MPESLHREFLGVAQIVSLVITGFFVAYAGRFSGNRISTVSAFAILLVVVQLHYLFWVYQNSEELVRVSTRNNHYSFFGFEEEAKSKISFFYAWLWIAMALGCLVWFRIRVATPPPNQNNGANSNPRFTLGTMLICTSAISILIGMFTQMTAFTTLLHYSGYFKGWSPSTTTCCFAAACLVLPVTKRLLAKSNLEFALASFVVWSWLLFGSWIAFSVIGLWQPSYNTEQQYILGIVTFSVATFLYLNWLYPVKLIAPIPQKTALPKEKWHAFKLASVVLSISPWAWLGFWFVDAFATSNEQRSLAWFDKSPTLMNCLSKSFGDDAIAEVQNGSNPQKLDEWINALGQHRSPKDSNVIYQIAKISKIPIFDQGDDHSFRLALGFTKPEIEKLEDESFETWIKSQRDTFSNYLLGSDPNSNMLSDSDYKAMILNVPWMLGEHPLELDFMKSKRDTCRQIRKAIEQSDSAFAPTLEEHFGHAWRIGLFATDLLTAESRLALAEDNLDLAIQNLWSIQKLIKIIDSSQLRGTSSYPRFRSLRLLLNVAETHSLNAQQQGEIRSLGHELLTPDSVPRQTQMLDFILLMHHYRDKFETGQLFPHVSQRTMNSLLATRIPKTISWESFVSEALHWHISWNEEFARNKFKHFTLKKSTYAQEAPQFHSQALTLFSSSGVRAKSLVREFVWLSAPHLGSDRARMAVSERLYFVALSIWLYKQEHGELPKNLEPLKCNVQDPLSKNSLVYQVLDDRFQLYSVGINGLDDNGLIDDIHVDLPPRTAAEYVK